MSFSMMRSMVMTFIVVIFIGVIAIFAFDIAVGGGAFPTKHENGVVAQIIPEFSDHGYDYFVQIMGDNGVVYKTTYYYRYNLPIVGQKVDVEYITSSNFVLNNRVVSVH